MQASNVIACLIVTLPLIMIFYAKYRPEELPVYYNVYKKANVNLQYVNNTPNLESVMKRFFYLLYVHCYRAKRFNEANDIIAKWCNSAPNKEVVNTLIYANADAKSLFWSVVDDADLKHEERVSFKVDETHDYHVIPKSLKYNDSFDIDALLQEIDILLEVK